MTTSMILTALALLSQSTLASPQPDTYFESSVFEEGKVDPSVLGPYLYAGGTITVAYPSAMETDGPSRVNLVIDVRKNCPPNAKCTAEMVYPIEVNLPVVETRFDACGSKIITARADSRPADGALEEIVIVDHRTLLCDVSYPHTTSVTYTTLSHPMGRGEARSISTFSGKPFVEFVPARQPE